MFRPKALLIALTVAAAGTMVSTNEADAGYYHQSYSRWTVHPTHNYCYCRYNYTVNTVSTYHYTVYRPATPRYVYYYNPVRRVYWGRYDFEKKGYSLLAKEDRKEDLDSIPESAFPEPGEMPPVPDSDGDTKMKVPSLEGLPEIAAAKDAPK